MTEFTDEDEKWMRRALELASQGYGQTSPNPMVGAVLTRQGKLIAEGWHHRAGEAHAEVDAMNQARAKRRRVKGTTLYVTLEPCSTEGRTPACTDAILEAGIEKVVVAAIDPNPRHTGKGLDTLRQAGLEVQSGLLAAEATALNEPFNHWIVRNTPLVTVKAAMTLDGKIATTTGESKWITGVSARARVMNMRQGADAILVGVNTVRQDDPSLTVRLPSADAPPQSKGTLAETPRQPRRLVLDTQALTPLNARLVTDDHASSTSIVVGNQAPKNRVAALRKKVSVMRAPLYEGRIDLKWLLRQLGREQVAHLLVEGGGEVNASFLLQGMAHRVAFFYAPKIVGGFSAPRAVAGSGIQSLEKAVRLKDSVWETLDADLLLRATVHYPPTRRTQRKTSRTSRAPRTDRPTPADSPTASTSVETSSAP